MIDLDFTTMNKIVDDFVEVVKKRKPAPVYYFPYIRRVLTERWDALKPEYPMTIKIPKSNEYLMKGDFEPAYEFVLDKPIMMDLEDGDPVPMWFGSTAKEAFLRFGFTNLDARFISDRKLDMEYIHGFLGGSTGHGKSVTLNSIIASLCFEYAPWELELHLSDAKIVEFKKYGIRDRIPHIQSIAATSDADYVVSVLDRAFEEMNQRSKFFVLAGASNLKSFRERTGLALPRVVIIMDEVESTFKMAGKQAGKIADRIAGFAQLGRAAGYHIIMATQNMSSDIPSAAVGQIRIRMCLGATAKVSEAVLANDGATENIGRIGRLIVNTEAMGGGKTQKDNVRYQTPFLSDDDFLVEMKFLQQKGLETPYRRTMSFYDEENMSTLEQFDPVIEKSLQRMRKEEPSSAAKVILGYPAFVTKDKDQLLKITLDGRDVENILICSAVEDKVRAHIYNITRSLMEMYTIMHFTTTLDMLEQTNGCAGKGEVREADSPFVLSVYNLIKKRIFMLQLEQMVGGASYKAEAVEELMREDGVPQSVFGNSLMYKRVTVYQMMRTSPEYKNAWNSVAGVLPDTNRLYQEYSKCNCIASPLTADKFKKACVIIGDISKVVGWGRSMKSSMVTELRKAMLDASRVGVVFVLYSRSMEGITELVPAIRYTVFDSPDKKDWGRMRTEEPVSQSPRLAVLYDSLNSVTPQVKFKCTLLHPKL